LATNAVAAWAGGATRRWSDGGSIVIVPQDEMTSTIGSIAGLVMCGGRRLDDAANACCWAVVGTLAIGENIM
jgi:hypothetical protein